MYAAGIDLHRISLGALIIALGLLVDDAIIAVEMMVVKMEEGWDRVSAATFSYTSTALPMLTGTLVTAAGFLPIGFAKSSTGEYAGGIFWIVGARAARLVAGRGAVHAVSRGEDAAGLGKHGARGTTRRIYDTRFYRGAARLIDAGASSNAGWVVGATVARVRARGRRVSGWCRSSSSRPRPRPELFVDLRLPEGTSFGATERRQSGRRRCSTDDPDIIDLHQLYRARARRASTCAQPGAAEPGLRPVRHRDQGPARRASA